MLAGEHPGLPGGESSAVYLDRVRAAFGRLETAHPGRTVLVVSHGETLGAYLAMHGLAPLAPLANASVTTVEVHADGARSLAQAAFVPTAENPALVEL